MLTCCEGCLDCWLFLHPNYLLAACLHTSIFGIVSHKVSLLVRLKSTNLCTVNKASVHWWDTLRALWVMTKAKSLRGSPRVLAYQPPTLPSSYLCHRPHHTLWKYKVTLNSAATCCWYSSEYSALARQNFLLKQLVAEEKCAETCRHSHLLSLDSEGRAFRLVAELCCQAITWEVWCVSVCRNGEAEKKYILRVSYY